MTEELKPCPWCAGTDIQMIPHRMSPTMEREGDLISVEVRHHCPPTNGQPSRAVVRIGRDYASAFDAWNARAESAGQKPVAKVHYPTTGGNVGVTWIAVSVDPTCSPPLLPPGTLLYAEPHSAESAEVERLRARVEELEAIIDDDQNAHYDALAKELAQLPGE